METDNAPLPPAVGILSTLSGEQDEGQSGQKSESHFEK